MPHLLVSLLVLIFSGCSTLSVKEPARNEYYANLDLPRFQAAQPIWPRGLETEKNLLVGFRAVFKKPNGDETILRITGSGVYRIYLNGRFIGHGPARGPHGYYRVDEWTLGKDLLKEENILAVEVAGYNINSYYLLDQPSFLQAEVVCRGQVLASTAGGAGAPFTATLLTQRLRKVQRASFQKTFIEYYQLEEVFDKWRYDKAAAFPAVECSVLAPKNLLPRRVPYPEFAVLSPMTNLSRGKILRDVTVTNPWRDRSLVNIGPKLKGFPEAHLDVVLSAELQKIQPESFTEINQDYTPEEAIDLPENSFQIIDLGANRTGFIGCAVECPKDTRLFLVFDEILTGQDVDFSRLASVAAVGYEFKPGGYQLETFEPYTLRYLKLIVLEGNCRIKNIYLREYANSDSTWAEFSCSDARLNQNFEAARQTFRQNAIDIFMDCPSRERAGWLCDSFFTARVAYDLCGDNVIEKNFLENFQLPAKFEFLPDGMLPMCYPADHNDGVFIPNWAMWFVLELQEYLARSGDRELIDALKPKVLALLDYFRPFLNEDGLLEKLNGWIFIEWSAAKDFVQDVNYPTNMLYAAALEAAGKMYQQEKLCRQAEKIRDTIRKLSFDGTFFTDNAVRKDGQLQKTANRTEVCQYYAFFFGLASPSSYPQLWDTLCHQFGPKRDVSQTWPEIYSVNSFPGIYLRLEILSRCGLYRQLKDEITDYFLHMAQQTGTLWENTDTHASCNHGFASHVAHVMYRDLLGIYHVDQQKKIVRLRLADVGLDWCEGKIPTAQGVIDVRWQRQGDTIQYHTQLPRGYKLIVETLGDIIAVPQP